MDSIKSSLPCHVHVVDNIQCTGTDHLHKYLASIVACQGEGIMLQKPNTLYETEYTSSLLKVKVREGIGSINISICGYSRRRTIMSTVNIVDNGKLQVKWNGMCS